MTRMASAVFVACFLLGRGSPLRADDPSEPKAIIDKAIKALGGEERMTKLPAVTWKAKSTIHVQGIDVHTTEEGAAQRADQYRVDLTQEFNGNQNRQIL